MMNHIVNNLWLGSQQDADDLVRSNPEHITAILNVRGPDAYRPAGRDQSAEHPGKSYKWIPAADIGVLSPLHTSEAVVWLQEQTDKGKHILIHCKHGISRSPGFLAAFMVASGISSSWEDAKAAISAHRPVLPATQFVDSVKPVLISELTGLPNRQSFDEGEGKASPFVAVADVSRMKVFNDYYGPIAGDALLRRLAKILIGVGLDAYHDREDEFLCKGKSGEELTAKLSQARQDLQGSVPGLCQRPHSNHRGSGFFLRYRHRPGASRGVTARRKKGNRKERSPEWLRRIIETGGQGQGW